MESVTVALAGPVHNAIPDLTIEAVDEVPATWESPVPTGRKRAPLAATARVATCPRQLDCLWYVGRCGAGRGEVRLWGDFPAARSKPSKPSDLSE